MHEILIYCSKNNALTYLKIEHKILHINIFCAFQQTLNIKVKNIDAMVLPARFFDEDIWIFSSKKMVESIFDWYIKYI